jgi:hypothetical protein
VLASGEIRGMFSATCAGEMRGGAMKFPTEFLRDDGGETVYDRITGHGRWTVHHERGFKHEGKFYLTTYSVGATENQNVSPYEYEGDEVECAEVFPRERVVTMYEKS